MKKFLLSVIAMFAIVATNAATVEFTVDNTWTEVTDPTYGAGFETENGGVTVALLKGGSSSSIMNPSEAGQIRHYKSSTMLIKSNATITNVVFTTTGGKDKCNNVEINGETVTADTESYTITWEGFASELVVSANEAQNRYSKITVTTEDAASSVAAPTFSPAAGTYYKAQSVTLSAEDGASIYYTTNGDDPTASSTEYTEPIEVAQTTTIKAIAVKDEVSSAVATATYTIVTATKVASIAEMLEQAEGTLVEFTSPVTVIFQDGNYMFVKDATGVTQFFGEVKTQYENGDVIPAGFSGECSAYNDVPQLTVWDTADSFVESTENNGEVDPTKYAVADVTNDLANQYVVIENVTITSEQSGDYTNYYANSGNDKVMIYARFSTFTNEQLAALEAGKEYNVAGFVTIFKGAPEIYIVSVTDPEGGDTPDPDPVDGVFFSTDFEDNDGGFTYQDITLPAGGSYVWKYDSKYGYWKGSAFISGTNYAAESWLVSPEIDLTKAKKAELVFDGLAKFLGGNPMSDYFKVKISIDYTKDVKAATWTEVTVNGIEESTDGWNFYTVTPIDLGGYIGKKIRIAFQYISTDSNAPTFEIDNLSVKGEETSGVVGVAAEGAVKVLGLDGEIAIVGEAADVEVYSLSGAVVAKGNLERVSCPQGIYVVKVDGNVQKVIVK